VSSTQSQLGWRVAAGDQVSCDRLYAEQVGRVRTYLRRCGFSPADVDDLSQEAFLRAFKSIRTFDASRGTPVQWLAGIVHNVARRQWARRSGLVTYDPELIDVVLADHTAENSAPETREELAALRQCIEVLASELARIVRLRYVDGRTTRGIADAEHLPEATVRLRLDEAKAVLERCLKSKGVW
jgi:RNA polymerase sigma-70 factor (ECF subfamily)